MNKTMYKYNLPVNTVLSTLAYRVYSVLCHSNRPISLSSLASYLHESVWSVKRAVNEIQKKGLWRIKFQILTDVLAKDDIYNLTNNTLNDILLSKKRNIHPTGINSACALWPMKVKIKEYLVSLLTKDMNKLRYWCREIGYSVNDSMNKEDLLVFLHDDYLVRFVKYHMTKMGTAFLDITEKELLKFFGYWLRTYRKGRRLNHTRVQEELREELDRVFPDGKYDPKEDMEVQALLYQEVEKIDMEEVCKRLESYKHCNILTITKERSFYEEEKIYESELVSGFDA